jgi:hypothetical protein
MVFMFEKLQKTGLESRLVFSLLTCMERPPLPVVIKDQEGQRTILHAPQSICIIESASTCTELAGHLADAIISPGVL